MLDKDFKPTVRFMVVSDIHIKDEDCIEEQRFDSALKYAYSIAKSSDSYKRLDAVAIVGDFANSGTEIQMKKTKDILDANLDYSETQVIASFASHESNRDGAPAAAERMKRILGQDADQHKVINGFHFVSSSPSKGCNYDDEKKAWMAKELEAAAKDDRRKPVFVFQHPHNTATVYGSMLWGEDDLISIYMNYPQIVHFSGHSHAPINDPRSVHQQHFTCFGTGTLSYFEMDEFDKAVGTIPEKSKNAAQMLIVEADEQNRVRVYPFDVITGNFFPYIWKIDTPSDIDSFEYTAKRYQTRVVPRFDGSAKITFSDVTDSSFKVEFDQAQIDKDYVNSYDLILKNSDGFVVRHLSIWSEYYFYDMPKTRTAEFSGLEPNTEYSLTIKAQGFWNNISENSLNANIKTL